MAKVVQSSPLPPRIEDLHEEVFGHVAEITLKDNIVNWNIYNPSVGRFNRYETLSFREIGKILRDCLKWKFSISKSWYKWYRALLDLPVEYSID